VHFVGGKQTSVEQEGKNCGGGIPSVPGEETLPDENVGKKVHYDRKTGLLLTEKKSFEGERTVFSTARGYDADKSEYEKTAIGT